MKNRNNHLALFLITCLVLLCCAGPGWAQTTEIDNSIENQIYQLINRSLQQVESDSVEEGLATIYLADSLAGACEECDDSVTVSVFDNLAYCLFLAEDLESAFTYLDSALATWQNLGREEDTVLSNIYGNYGRFYYFIGEFEKSRQAYEKGLGIIETALGKDHVQVAITVGNLAITHCYLNDWKQAESLFKRAMDIWIKEFGPESDDVGMSLLNLGNVYEEIGNLEEAEHCFTEALRIRTKTLGPDHSRVGFCYWNLASLQARVGKADTSLANFYKALNIIEKSLGKDNSYYATLLLNIGMTLLQDFSRYAEAESLCRRSMSIMEEIVGPNNRVTAAGYEVMASLDNTFGRYESALEYSLRSAEINKTVFGVTSVDYLKSIGDVVLYYSRLIDRNDDATAKVDSLYTEYAGIIEQIEPARVYEYNLSLSSFAEALTQRGRFEEALALMNRIEIQDSSSANHIFKILYTSYIHMYMGNEDEALALVQKAPELLADSSSFTYSKLSGWYGALGKVHLFCGKLDKALAYYKKSDHYRNRFLDLAFTHASQMTKVTALNNTDECAFLLNMVERHGGKEALVFGLEHTLMDKSYVMDAISTEHEAIQCSDDPALRAIWDEYSDVSSRAASLARSGFQNDGLGGSEDLFYSLVRERDSLETAISHICGENATGSFGNNCRTEDVAGQLDNDELLIEYVRFLSSDSLAPDITLHQSNQYDYGVFVLDSDSNLDFFNLGRADIIDSIINLSRRQVNEAGTKVFSSLGATIEQQYLDVNDELYSLLVSPLQNRIKEKTHLIVAPDKNICLIPFESLPDGSGRYLLEKYRISYLSSGKELLARADTNADNASPIVMFADPDFDFNIYAEVEPDSDSVVEDYVSDENEMYGYLRSGENCGFAEFKRLPFTGDESKLIEDIIRERSNRSLAVYTGPRAREKSLKDLPETPFTLHVATHGFVCHSKRSTSRTRDIFPMFNSGLALAGANVSSGGGSDISSRTFEDGILSAYEVSALNLIGTNLVVLSACETGVGEYVNGMGVMGLRSSFRQAGAHSLIMSLWKVPDELSSRMMAGFYERWLSGESKIDALRNTSLELLKNAREEYGNSHPIHWSGFILSGKSN